MLVTKASFISTRCGCVNAVGDAGGELSSAERACVVLDVGGDDGDELSEFRSSGLRACGVLNVDDDERDERSEFRPDASLLLDEDEL